MAEPGRVTYCEDPAIFDRPRVNRLAFISSALGRHFSLGRLTTTVKPGGMQILLNKKSHRRLLRWSQDVCWRRPRRYAGSRRRQAIRTGQVIRPNPGITTRRRQRS